MVDLWRRKKLGDVLDVALPSLASLSKATLIRATNEQDLEDDSMKRLASVLLLFELLTGCVTSTQMEMDAEVDRLCAIDGGLKIYETVSLPPEKFNKHNEINFFHFSQGENALGPEYVFKWAEEFLHPGGNRMANPKMIRDHLQIFRRSDMRLLGELISYGRIGGSPIGKLTGWHHPSSYYCPENLGSYKLFNGVFVKMKQGGRDESADR